MTRRFIRAVLLCAITGFATAQQTSTIQTETRVVLVDAIVTAKNGAYVRNLTQHDFQISEDNKDQNIRSFSLETSAGASQPRSLVLFFDQSSMEARDQIPALLSASRFIDAETGPNRRMAIVSYSGALRVRQNFTDDAARLKEALPGPASRVTVAKQAGGFVNPLATAESESSVRGPEAIDDTGSRNMLQALRYVGTNLGVLPGRKIVVVFAGRIPSSSSQRSDLKEVIDACNKSGVAVYPVGAQGISVASIEALPQTFGRGRGGNPADSDLGAADGGDGGQQLLAELATRTGGFVIWNSNDLLGHLESIAAEQDQYYVLTFTPPESKEGSCHTLRVKVDRPGTRVRARNSYCTVKAPDLLAGTIMGKELERRVGEARQGSITASVGLPWFYSAPNMARVHLAAEITPGALKFERVKGRLHAEINLLGMAGTEYDGVRARFSDNLKFDFDNEAEVEAWKMKPLHYEKEFRVAPGEYKFTLAFGQAGERDATFGKVESPLKIDPWNGTDLGMSGLVLSRETHPAGDIGLSLMIGDQTPLVAGGTQVVPYGSDSFARSGPGFFCFEVYDANPASVTVRVRVLDRKTESVKWDSGNTRVPLPGNDGKPSLPAMANLPLDKLTPGDWRLEVTASDLEGKTVSRSVDFGIYQARRN